MPPSGPNSLTKTAVPDRLQAHLRICVNRVVLPAPMNPAISMTFHTLFCMAVWSGVQPVEEPGVKFYTGRGDRGKTNLYSGERVAKGHPRLEAYGDIDELNSLLGGVLSTLQTYKLDLSAKIRHIQSLLFVAGAWLATTPNSPQFETMGSIGEFETKMLEEAIDLMGRELPPINKFLLPGGHISACFAHIARTVCRRAERHVVLLAAESSGGKEHNELMTLLKFLNRLSSFLFVLARYLNSQHGVSEIAWNSRGSDLMPPE